jgi:hypothetical protein
MNKPSKQPTDSAPRESIRSAVPPDQNRVCGTHLLRKGLNSMNDIQRASFFKTMKEIGLSPFI